MAIDHADGRLLEVLEQGVRPLEIAPELALAAAEEAAALLVRLRFRMRRVSTGREHGRSAGHDDHARRRVVAQLGECRREIDEHGIAQRVAALGAIERDGGDDAIAREGDVVSHAQARAPLGATWATTASMPRSSSSSRARGARTVSAARA